MRGRCLLIEQEKGSLSEIKEYIEGSKSFVVDGVIGCEDDILDFMLTKRVQLIFLDVPLLKEKVFKLVADLKLLCENLPKIILVATNKSANELLGVGVGYVLEKPVNILRLEQVLVLLKKQLANKSRYLVVKTSPDYNFIKFSSILYLRAESNYTHIVKKDMTELVVAKSLRVYEDLLPQNFMRIHKKYIVNTNFIKKYVPKTKQLVIGADDVRVVSEAYSQVNKDIKFESKSIRLDIGKSFYKKFTFLSNIELY